MNFYFKYIITEEFPEIGDQKVKSFPEKDSKSDTGIGENWLLASFKLTLFPTLYPILKKGYLAERITVKR